ncbi:carbon-nitrogen hydrolase family protein [Helicobacter sp.]|uniref:carbon-nitrogen hydrolase family protein n=1 Tax=Helicobacter sp. TaxID=218 RepID=UPI0025C490AF|nr:carbon-nitrogen hydrolase family protein [Helicobacter sp.]MCI5967997.1 carbon-nitrogen hydrolase family protein [Helicobacter sp.]MDY2584648.1 carbon-nitrogen hydrolase family protein [Helicobacter sp.]
MKISALQLSNSRTQDAIESYIKTAVDAKVRVILFGEYLLNPFFKDLEMGRGKKIDALERIKRETDGILKLSAQYNIVMVAPVFEVIRDKIYKTIFIVNKGKALSYRAQKLMPYAHWNEEKFFANTLPKHPKTPPIFNVGGFKFAAVFGYELHFDDFWLKLKAEGVDCVLLPTASTFDSSLRWRSIIKMRAFLNSCYILRANRIGQYQDSPTQTLWNFYGDSLFVSPNGEIIDCLGDREELLIVEVDKKYLKEIKDCWRFR